MYQGGTSLRIPPVGVRPGREIKGAAGGGVGVRNTQRSGCRGKAGHILGETRFDGAVLGGIGATGGHKTTKNRGGGKATEPVCQGAILETFGPPPAREWLNRGRLRRKWPKKKEADRDQGGVQQKTGGWGKGKNGQYSIGGGGKVGFSGAGLDRTDPHRIYCKYGLGSVRGGGVSQK